MWIFTKFVSPWVEAKERHLSKIDRRHERRDPGVAGQFQGRAGLQPPAIIFASALTRPTGIIIPPAIVATLANSTYTPVMAFSPPWDSSWSFYNGIYLITAGQFTVGFLISFFMYVNSFYDPLRQLAALWAGFQTAICRLGTSISRILNLESDLTIHPAGTPVASTNGHGPVNGDGPFSPPGVPRRLVPLPRWQGRPPP